MRYREEYQKRKGSLIWFGESEDTSDLNGIVCGYNDSGCILMVTHGEGDYKLKPEDVIPDNIDRHNEKGYMLNDLQYIEFDN